MNLSCGMNFGGLKDQYRFGSVKQLDVESHFRATISDRVIRFIYELTFHDHHRQDVMNTVLNIMSYKIVALLTQHAISRLTIGHFHEIYSRKTLTR